MTKPTPKPTVASLRKELARVRIENEQLRGLVQVTTKERDDSRLHFEILAERMKQVRSDLAPLLAYLQSGWLGPVQANYQRLKAFVEGGNG